MASGAPAFSAHSRHKCAVTPATGRGTLAGMNTSLKLQKAGRAFLLRLVAENGPEEAAQTLRDLAQEIEGLAAEQIKAARAG
jgi:hypothetical protein